MNCAELEFLAEDEPMEIIPKFSVNQLSLIQGDFGEIKAGLPKIVPMWVALHLRQMNKCTISCPDWMTVPKLEIMKSEEKSSPYFTKMPSDHYMTLAKMLYQNCPQDIPDADHVKVLIKDIWDNRVSKLRTAIHAFLEQGAAFAKVDNLTQVEIATVRPFFPFILEILHRTRKGAQEASLSNLAKSSISSLVYDGGSASGPSN